MKIGKESGVKLGLLVGLLLVSLGLIHFIGKTGSKRSGVVQTHKAVGEYLVLSNHSVGLVLSQLDVKSGAELVRREVSRLALGSGNLEELNKSVVKFKEEYKDSDLVSLGRGVRLVQILYEAGQVEQAKEVLGVLANKPVKSYSEGLLAVREVVAAKGNDRFKVRVEQYEEVLAVVAINKVLELNLPVGDLVKGMVQSVKWNSLGDGTEVGKVYLLQLVGVYAGQDYYTSGLYGQLKNYWSHKKDSEFLSKARVIEALAFFKILNGEVL